MNLSSANAMLACICIHIKDASARALTAIDQPLPQEEGHRAVSPHLHTDSFVGKSTTYRQPTVALIANVKPQSAQEPRASQPLQSAIFILPDYRVI